MRALILSAIPLLVLAGCTTPDAALDADLPADSDLVPMPEPWTVTWEGNVVVGVIDIFAHDIATEGLFFSQQQAGFLLDLTEAAEAIEVRVDWMQEGASFRLHPHRLLGDDESGTTRYYGYHSQSFTSSPGCIRLPVEDMAAGVWPMMIHPGLTNTNVEYTITVGLVGGAGTVMDELHGHRADGNYVIEPHEVSECEFLLDMEMAGHSHA